MKCILMAGNNNKTQLISNVAEKKKWRKMAQEFININFFFPRGGFSEERAKTTQRNYDIYDDGCRSVSNGRRKGVLMDTVRKKNRLYSWRALQATMLWKGFPSDGATEKIFLWFLQTWNFSPSALGPVFSNSKQSNSPPGHCCSESRGDDSKRVQKANSKKIVNIFIKRFARPHYRQ